MNLIKQSEVKYYAVAFFETISNINLNEYSPFQEIYEFNTIGELTNFCIAVNTIGLISELIERSFENDVNIDNNSIVSIEGVDRNILDYIINLKKIDDIIYYDINLNIIADGILYESIITDVENGISMKIYQSINKILENEIYRMEDEAYENH